MDKILHIVNGDLNLQILAKAKIGGDFLMWGDFLYSGEIKSGISLEKLSKIRAKYISSIGLGEFNKIYQEFKARDSKLTSFKRYHKIYLWFESDIYDQLQLIQILDWFRKYAQDSTNIYIINIKKPLITSSEEEILDYLIFDKERVRKSHYILAKKAWYAFGADTPYTWYRLLFDDIKALPNMKPTIFRVLEEYPNSLNGLNRTEYQILKVINSGEESPKKIYIKTQKMEERPFMGAGVFSYNLRNLSQLNLLNYMENGKRFKITSFGERVLKSEDFLYKHKKLDRWIGGVHLSNDNLWCWDIDSSSIIEY